MSYVDLNPIRAGIADDLESSTHTSAVHRITRIKAHTSVAMEPLAAINASTNTAFLSINTGDCLDLIDWTARLTRPDTLGKIAATEPPILRKLGLAKSQWCQQMLGTETRNWRAIGSARALIEKATAIGQSWLKGTGQAQRLMRRQVA